MTYRNKQDALDYQKAWYQRNKQSVIARTKQNKLKNPDWKKLKDPIYCKHCNASFRPYRNSVGFCSLKCFQGFNFDKRYSAWINGGEYSIENTTWLRKALSKRDPARCSVCGITDWAGKPIVLQVDHIDGNSTDGSSKNTRLICPNCHSQTSTYGNRNKGRGREKRRRLYIRTVSQVA